MRIVVITSCTGEKRVHHEQALTLADFQAGTDHVAERERQLEELLTPAEHLYTGQQHVRLMRGVEAVRTRPADDGEKIDLNLWILSAGYGLVPADRRLAPYEATFIGMKRSALRKWAGQLELPSDFRKALREPHDLAVVLLGDSYLEACTLDDDVVLGGPTLIFCGQAAAKRLPSLPDLHPVVLSNREAKRFSCGLVGLKGELGGQLLSRIAADPGLLPGVATAGADVLQLLDSGKAAAEKSPPRKGPIANPAVDHVIQIPRSWWDRPHRDRLMYFIPEWDDLVDPDYDFETDTHSGGSGDWSNEVYAHQMYPEPNYDGLLISKVVAEKSRKKKERINALGVHRFLRVPREMPIMGDCGAFGYIGEENPPYTTTEILDYYTRLDFDYGVSIDHLIVKSTDAQRNHRYDLTVHNAEEFLREHEREQLSWVPIGAVQGWDAHSYAEAARQYVAMGYRYIALGGLVRTSTPEILRVLEEVHRVVPADVRIHLFGLARIRALAQFADLGVRSVDSASYLRQAWIRDKEGYLALEGPYASVRIPEVGKSFRAKRMLAEAGVAEELARQKEAAALAAVRCCDGSSTSVDHAVAAVMEYDALFRTTKRDDSELYRRTLSEQPWRRCTCAICQQDGVEVIIFRGNNRNRRRGFHNTFVFYRILQDLLNGNGAAGWSDEGDAVDNSQPSLFDQVEARV